MNKSTEQPTKETPLPFQPEMVQATLADRKDQTRRLKGLHEVNKEPDGWLVTPTMAGDTWAFIKGGTILRIKCPYGQVGDRLWVRETAWYPPPITDRMLRDGADTWPKVFYSADGRNFDDLKEWGWKQKPSIFMPRWASRITLEITDVRVQRVQEISNNDAWAEGTDGVLTQRIPNCVEEVDYIEPYHQLWNSINAKRGYGWDKNPWVWAISYKKLEVKN
jgi:hypothetical protein